MLRYALLSLTLAFSSALQAEQIIIPLGQQGGGELALPSRGASKGAVLERFGLPDNEHSPVGQPPITRWDYRIFSVYFEGDRVIDSVIDHRPLHLPQDQQQP
ncbi:phosphodiesterase [Stutzerimonas balearica]|uniref:phosphodiesterase n=1 Tax=Stutzerimonas balearica TaxID=74829 RepID=UPI000E973863|nr:phosphodiesterase [Stutzerimonas balearica]HAV89396.1 phosphodiesterase [Pseudomonas sp.]